MTGELLAAAAMAGIAASPHCAGMCGPLVTAGCSGGARARVSDALGYHLGRATSYAFVGALAGHASYAVLGGATGATLTAITSGLVAVVLLASAARVVFLEGRASTTEPTLVTLRREPRRPTVIQSLARWLPRKGLALGLVTGVLPCGASLGGALLAASSTNALEGAALMVVFALASAPVLVAFALVGTRIARSARRMPRVLRAALLVGAAALAASRPFWAHQDTTCHAAAEPPSSLDAGQ